MDQKKVIGLNGIQRNSPQGTADACDELINLRFRDNAWEPVGQKEILPYPVPGLKPVIIHKMDSDENWIGYDSATKRVYYFNKNNATQIQTLVTLTAEETLQGLQYLKRFALVITDQNLYTFLYKNEPEPFGTYTQITLTGIETRFDVLATPSSVILVNEEAERATTAEGVLGKYYKLLREQSEEGKHYGGMFIRTVLKLYDGTQIMHTVPKFYQVSSHGGNIKRYGAEYELTLDELCGIQLNASYSEFWAPGSFEDLKDIISSIVVYSSKIEQLYDISETTMTDDNFSTWFPADGAQKYFKDIFAVSDDFKKDINDSAVWYKIGEVDFSSLKKQAAPFDYLYTGEVETDLKGFYTNYATHETIEVDNFSHHELTGNAVYMYNSRVHLGDTLQTLSNEIYFPDIAGATSTPVIANPYGAAPATLTYQLDNPAYYETMWQIKLNTTDGIKYLTRAGTIAAFKDSLNIANKAVFLPGQLGYFDARATEIVLSIKVGAVYYEILRKPLKKSLFGNYSYLAYDQFNPEITNPKAVAIPLSGRVDGNFVAYPVTFRLITLPVADIKTELRTVKDRNRVQASSVDNPFVFPVKNSQQIGTSGTIRAMGSNSEDVSSGQYGEFPLYVFSSEGTWGIGIGSGDVYFTNISPLNGEVIRDNYSKLDLSFGIAYISSEGLRIISGKDIIDISDAIEGLQDRNLSLLPMVPFILSHSKLVQLSDLVDLVPFKTYMQNAGMGYNKGLERSEICVFNPAYPYYYVYDLQNKYWSKIKGKLDQLITSCPDLYAVETVSDKIINLSNEIAGNVQVAFLTRANGFGDPRAAKKLRRSFVRCHLNVPAAKYAGAWLFRTDDAQSWKYVTGNDHGTGNVEDIWLTHSLNSARYYAYLFASEVENDHASKVNYITGIEAEFEPKMGGKLR